MRIKTLLLENFGPFRKYTVPFVDEEPVCVLLTGKNNEGKSNIILALKLIASGCRSVGRRQQSILIDDDEYYRLPQPDTDGINIGRTLHNYTGGFARIVAEFEKGFRVIVRLDEGKDLIYADIQGRIPADVHQLLGFIPPLGPLAEEEEFLTLKYVKANMNTSLAPRHLRNYLLQILDTEEYGMVRDIIGRSWPSITLLDCEHQRLDNTLRCFFREGRIDREIAWAGQGLQVWFQIITHLVRLRYASILVLDEPEVNLHAEKQIELVKILREYRKGSTIIATHSVELMNNVNVSHIVHVQKNRQSPAIKSTKDRTYLELVRSQIGSNFNLVASQFENFDVIIFTEDTTDYVTLHELAEAFGISRKSFNIPLHGFSEYPKAIHYSEAYRLLIGGDARYSVLLDRDYYPEEHLKLVKEKLEQGGLRAVFTPGKEIENIFLSPDVLAQLIPVEFKREFDTFWEQVFAKERLDCYGSYLTLHGQFLPRKMDPKSVTTRYTPPFEARWKDPATRHTIIGGKRALQHVRGFYRDKTGCNLTSRALVEAAVKCSGSDLPSLVAQIYHEKKVQAQILHI